MKRLWQALANVALYSFLAWLLVDSTIWPWYRKKEWDPWFAFVIAFVILVAIITSLIPSLRVEATSPSEYPNPTPETKGISTSEGE
jgi:hypothetical protein